MKKVKLENDPSWEKVDEAEMRKVIEILKGRKLRGEVKELFDYIKKRLAKA